MRLLDRIFSRARSQEDMATEMIAFFLDQCEPFLEQFLRHIDVSIGDGAWHVDTQHVLAGDGEYKGKRPDLVMRCAAPRTLIAVEAKIDAGTTYDGDVPQTQFYANWLLGEEKNGETPKLVTLTRWTPPPALINVTGVECNSIRYYDVATWLDTAADEVRLSSPVIADLGKQFVRFLRRRRWAMPELGEDHLMALRELKSDSLLMREIGEQAWDTANAAAQRAVADKQQTWQWLKGSRGSSGRCDILDLEGTVKFIAPIGLHAVGEADGVHLGLFYGRRGAEPAIHTVIYSKIPGNLGEDWERDDPKQSWIGKNLAGVLDKKRSTAAMWSEALEQFQAGLDGFSTTDEATC